MPAGEAVSITRLHILAKPPLRRGPEHEVERSFSRDGIAALPAADRVCPLRPNPAHEFRSLRERVGFLEEQVGVPLRLTATEEGRHARFDLQPLLDRRHLNREIRPVCWSPM